MKQQIGQVKEVRDEPHVNIIDTLVELDKGRFIINAGREFGELMHAIAQTKKKKGKITITLDVAPSGWEESTGDVLQVSVTPSISITKPKRDPNHSTFFVTEDLNLQRNDPAQEAMFEK